MARNQFGLRLFDDLHGISPKLPYGSSREETQALAKTHWISRIWMLVILFEAMLPKPSCLIMQLFMRSCCNNFSFCNFFFNDITYSFKNNIILAYVIPTKTRD